MKIIYIKKYLVSLVVMIFMFSGASSISFAESVSVGDIVYDFRVVDEEIVLYRVTSDSDITKLELPDKLNGRCITAIMGCRDKNESFGAFQSLKNLEEIVVPKGITTIGTNAFRNCANLELVNLPESVRVIDVCAFMHCTKLKAIYLPKNVERVRYNAFAECTNLEKVYAPLGTTFDEGALEHVQVEWY